MHSSDSTSVATPAEPPAGTVIQDPLTHHHSFIAARAFETGACISPFRAAAQTREANRFTVQVGPGQHIVLEPGYLQYINHSCDPNAFFNTTTGELVALRTIREGDEITFFYPSTEWDMSEPFACRCGSANCLQQISGASALPRNLLQQYRLSDHIRQLLALPVL
ncbi:MAG TPA: SET domain-containing protein-lysine N-methyltransferase [Lacibacter sp.]|nr:SET domain-containing protein-lysine N-methyltransferase [Lacibacter sp.]HMO90292.1 SET domain-containing protein-lysine N-methyltransferase [Lacibacter sp.]HMP86986.1 SET domain-containing protein-lysine N-methyltransferase [Lacibacter sp.]